MTLVAVLGLAVVDSVNPSALVVTIYLLVRRAPASMAVAYLATIFAVYFSIGVLLMLSADAVWGAASGWLETSTAYGVQLVIGAGLLVYAVLAPGSSRAGVRPVEPRTFHWSAMIPLGFGVTLLELPTALPYFAAIGVITNSALPIAQWAAYLLVYNAIFILPPAGLFIAGRVARSKIEDRLAGLESWLQRNARETLLWIIGIVGFFLLMDALAHFEFFGFIDVDVTPDDASGLSD